MAIFHSFQSSSKQYIFLQCFIRFIIFIVFIIYKLSLFTPITVTFSFNKHSFFLNSSPVYCTFAKFETLSKLHQIFCAVTQVFNSQIFVHWLLRVFILYNKLNAMFSHIFTLYTFWTKWYKFKKNLFDFFDFDNFLTF